MNTQHLLEQSVVSRFNSPNQFSCVAQLYFPDRDQSNPNQPTPNQLSQNQLSQNWSKQDQLKQDMSKAAYPAILMVHGWGGTQELLTLPFIHAFLNIGYAVMTFDYSTWGKSEGYPRNQISPWLRVAEAERAIEHLKQQQGIDPTKIVIWGTSFGGGHAVELAAKRHDLLGVIAHVPMLDGLQAVLANPIKDMLKVGWLAFTDFLPKQDRTYIPVIAAEHEFATMNRDNAYDFFLKNYEALGCEIQDYDNRVTARSVLGIGAYRPIRQLNKVHSPVLLIGALNDSVAPFDEDKVKKLKNPRIEYKTLNANHFEPYFEPFFSQNIQYQVDFLKRLLAEAG